ncbi:hypothetical protein AMTR_s03490p00003860 [Amborella trichopoda]|uniref:Uncharacterized protein n=1 Tax=Amborella trichopoda TaxID=13333 RepID=U5CLP8_AMBTC|nr:hypothetical protein AMTR_s03490p00003860 [Amborella trichopoda]
MVKRRRQEYGIYYDFIPLFCPKCKIFGHLGDECEGARGKEQGEKGHGERRPKGNGVNEQKNDEGFVRIERKGRGRSKAPEKRWQRVKRNTTQQGSRFQPLQSQAANDKEIEAATPQQQKKMNGALP